MLIDFENVQSSVEHICKSNAFLELIELTKCASDIYIIGNGGLHYVGSHMATDMTRLIDNKSVYSFDSFGFITSTANDHGYEEIFQRWLSSTIRSDNFPNVLVIGLSCSGASSNITNTLRWAKSMGGNIFLLAGANKKPSDIKGLQMGFEYFHTVEVATMFLLYELIHQVGSECPSIKKENLRNVNSSLRQF
tara:strand:- start:144 stop:719 length:576 start_codon:yes stop_codon:yes gene_type:complete